MRKLRYPPASSVLHSTTAAALLLAAALLAAAAAGAHGQHAHTHGQLSIDVAVDARSITIGLATPLDNLVGFERAPRTDAERTRVAEAVARLEAADRLFVPDPAARCTLSRVSLSSAVLGLAEQADSVQPERPSKNGPGAGPGDHDTHADVDATIVYDCGRGDLARFVDVKLFEQFGRVRIVQATVASPQGQFKHTLRAKNPRLAWGR